MSVPPSGNISMLGLAREKVYNDYDYYNSPTGPYSLKDLAEGGEDGGSGVNFESTNTNSISNPNTTTPHEFSEWYSYNHDAVEQ